MARNSTGSNHKKCFASSFLTCLTNILASRACYEPLASFNSASRTGQMATLVFFSALEKAKMETSHKITAELGNEICCRDLLWKSIVEISCWVHLLRSAVEIICLDQLLRFRFLRLSVELSCWHHLLKSNIEIISWFHLLRSTAEIICLDTLLRFDLLRLSVEIYCCDHLLKSTSELIPQVA